MTAFLKNFLIAAAWLGGLGVLSYLFQPDAWLSFFSGTQAFWDTEHYAFIATEGYDELRVAFFPGFAMLWKWTGLGFAGISLLNAVLACIGFSALMSTFKAKGWEVALCLSQPLLLFWCVPYSESLFFLFTSLGLIALHRRLKWALLASMILAAYCRPLWSVLVPAFVILLLIHWKDKEMRSLLLLGLLGIAAGSFEVFQAHFVSDFGWSGFFDAQREWGNALRLPELPLSSWSQWQIVVLDAAAFSVGVGAGFILLMRLRKGLLKEDVILHLSLLYLLGVTLLVLLFRGGEMFSLGRFVFTTPFFPVALLLLHRKLRPDWKSLRWLVLPVLVAVCFGAYVHVSYLLKFLLLPFVMMLLLFTGWIPMKASQWTRWLFILAMVLLNLYFWSRAMAYEWIG